MEIIRYANNFYMSTLGRQPVYFDKNYRWNKCLLCVEIDGGKLILNELTRAIVFLNDQEMPDLKDKKLYEFLYRTYFLVEEDFDEFSKIDMIRDLEKTPIDSLYLEYCNNYLILTTLACNANCSYCYESKKGPESHMTKNTAIKVAKYILEHSQGNHVHIQWFGGEPLFNMKVIDTIHNYLRDYGKFVTSSFTTNGYLFNDYIINKAINSWNTERVQITLDGTEAKYNKIKNYSKSSGSPYKTVINNIQKLLNLGIKVTIRLNVGIDNGEDLYDLVHILYNTFGVDPNLVIYCWQIFNKTGNWSFEQESLIYDSIAKIENFLIECGYPYGTFPSETIQHNQCMADSGDSILISPQGDLGTCEHYVDSKFWGNINSSDKNMDILNSWRVYEPKMDLCENCPIYGDCIRPSECEEMKRCSLNIKERNIRKAKEGLLSYYIDYKYKQANESILSINECTT